MTFEQWFPTIYTTRSKVLTEKELLKEAWDSGRKEERDEMRRTPKRRGPISEFEDPRD